MKKHLLIILSFTFISQSAHAQESGIDALLQMESVFTNIADSVSPSIVAISVYAKTKPPGPNSPPVVIKKKSDWELEFKSHLNGYDELRSASGLVLSEDGYIVCCWHFLMDRETEEIAEYIDVEIEKLGFARGRVVGMDPFLNLALLKVELHDFAVPAKLGDSEKLKMGHWVIALGDPPGPDKTFSVGNICGMPQRDCYQASLTVTQVQSSVSVPLESFGGPLVNLRGEVIGISVPRQIDKAFLPLPVNSGQGSYAIPIKLVTTVLDAFKLKESKKTPFLGLAVLELTGSLRKQMKNPPYTGVYIDNIFSTSPAFDADIRIGDVIISMDTKKIFSVRGFQKSLYTLGIGKEFEIEISRDGETLIKDITIVQRPEDAEPN